MKPFFSILIPTWNNLAFLKLCIDSIKEHSVVQHELIVHVNEGSDGTLNWVQENKIKHTYTEKNEGVCVAMNKIAALSTSPNILYLNDDMYVLPHWDICLKKEIESLDHDMFCISSTSIEATPQSNCMIQGDFGTTPGTFNKDALLQKFKDSPFHDWSGSTWPPCVVSKRLWDEVGGYSEEFSPGMYSDPDFSMKLWQAGVRYFKGLGDSRVYHFGSKSVGRVKKNNGRKQFIKKWEMTPSIFCKYYLNRGQTFSYSKNHDKIPVRLLMKSKILSLLYYFN